MPRSKSNTVRLFTSCFWSVVFLLLPGKTYRYHNPAPAWIDGQETLIMPIANKGRLLLLRATVDGITGDFILDTGANGLVLNDQYFKAQYPLRHQVALGMYGVVNGAGLMNIDSFHLDALSIRNINAQTINLRAIEDQKKHKILGLIGYQILKDFEIHFNYRGKYIIMSQLDRKGRLLDPIPATTDKIDSTIFEMSEHLPTLKVNVNEQVKTMGLDCGSEYNLLNIRRFRDIKDQFQILNRMNIRSADGKEVEVIGGRLYRLKAFEQYQSAGMATILTNFTHINRLFGRKLDGVLGGEFLAPWRFSLNYRQEKLYLHKLRHEKP